MPRFHKILKPLTTTREQDRLEYIAAHVVGPYGVQPLPADASARQYFRIIGTHPPRLLMDVPPSSETIVPFVTIATHLQGLGLSAPKIYAHDPDQGLAVIEDFGRLTFTQLLAANYSEHALYEQAVDLLAALHEMDEACTIALPTYDMGHLSTELEMFTDWFASIYLQKTQAQAFGDAFMSLWNKALAPVAGIRSALVLRDFHVDNLMILPERTGVSRCGLLDFQDALLGAPAYDLVSLTQDARRHVSPAFEGHLIDYYLAQRPQIERGQFLKEYHLLGAHRATKLVGNFERLSRRDGKHGYLAFLPRVMQLLEAELNAAGLWDILALLNADLPNWKNHAPHSPQG